MVDPARCDEWEDFFVKKLETTWSKSLRHDGQVSMVWDGLPHE